MRSKLLTALLICVAPVFAEELVLNLDATNTTVHFTLPGTLHTVHGVFKLKHGNVRYDPATGKIAGVVVVDATSGNSGDGSRDKRMHKDILQSPQYPEIVFTPDRVDGAVAPQGTSQVQVHGIFTIHGAGHEITIPVEVHTASGHTTATARFSIPYVKWGMKNPSTLFLRVSEKVELEATTGALP
jgi:polyisoprenoid-binding protein YceI